MLVVFYHLPVFHMPQHSFQEDLYHELCQHRSEASMAPHSHLVDHLLKGCVKTEGKKNTVKYNSLLLICCYQTARIAHWKESTLRLCFSGLLT